MNTLNSAADAVGGLLVFGAAVAAPALLLALALLACLIPALTYPEFMLKRLAREDTGHRRVVSPLEWLRDNATGLGMLGTVAGLIVTLDAAGKGSSVDTQALIGNFGPALGTTLLGLLVSLEAQFGLWRAGNPRS